MEDETKKFVDWVEYRVDYWFGRGSAYQDLYYISDLTYEEEVTLG